MEMMVTGSTGRLGGALVREWEGGHMLQAPGREDLDLGKPGELEKKLESGELGGGGQIDPGLLEKESKDETS